VSSLDTRQKSIRIIVLAALVLAVVAALSLAAQDKYTVKVPGGLAFSEFKGYEAWQAISISRNERVLAMTLGNPAMIGLQGRVFPATARPSPTGPRRLRSFWTLRKNEFFPDATVPEAPRVMCCSQFEPQGLFAKCIEWRTLTSK